MSKNIYNSIYEKLVKIGILSLHGEMVHSYMRFTSHGLMDLSCDKLSESMISLAHNGVLNGDLMCDPDVQIVVCRNTKTAVGITYQNDYLGIFQDINATGKVNEAMKKDINIFIDDWLSNIINSEYKLTEIED
jgi:hypothetical protein